MAENKIEIILSVKNLAKKGLETAKIGLENVGKQADKVRANLNKMKKGVSSLGLIFAGVATATLKASGTMEQWRISFETMLGSAEKADKLLKEITDFTSKTPLELPGVIESSKQLLAFGIEADKIIETMKSLGDISAGIGTEKLPTLVNALGKVRTKGKASMEELNMFLEAGVPILDELANGFDVSTQELFKMITAGTVGFDDVNNALLRLTTGNGKFANLMDKQSQSLFGIFSNIKDNITQILIALGDELLPITKKISVFLKDLTTNLVSFIKENPKIAKLVGVFILLGSAIGVIAASITALTFIGIPSLIVGIGGLAVAFNSALGGIPLILTVIIGSFLLVKNTLEKIIVRLGDFIESVGGWKTIFLEIKKTAQNAFLGIKNGFIEAGYLAKKYYLLSTNLLNKNKQKLLELEEKHLKDLEDLEEDKKETVEKTQEEIDKIRDDANSETQKQIKEELDAKKKALEENAKNAKNADKKIQESSKSTKNKNIDDYKDWKLKTQSERDLSLDEELKYLEDLKTNKQLNSEELKAIDEEYYKLKADKREEDAKEEDELKKDFEAKALELLNNDYERKKTAEQIEKDHKDSLEEINKEYTRKLEDINNTQYENDEEKQKALTELELWKNRELEDLQEETNKKRKENEGNSLKDMGEMLKKAIKNQIDTIVAGKIGEIWAWAWGAALATFGGSLIAAVGATAGLIAAGTAAKSAVDGITFHDGGIVGEERRTGLKPNEVNATLLRGERVMTQPTSESMLGAIKSLNTKLDNMQTGKTKAMSGGDLSVPVYLDGKVITNAVIKNYNNQRRVNTITKIRTD